VGVQPTLVPKERSKRRGGLSKLVPLATSWKGSGKTQNIAPFFDKVREPVTRIERWPRSIDALEEAREMPPGAPRTEALKRRAFSVEMLTIKV